MDELISRQAAIDGKISIQRTNGVEIYYDEAVTVKYLMMLPSAQPEIIRCKECKWCEERYDSIDKTLYWMCKNWDGQTDADGFCYDAERRTDV